MNLKKFLITSGILGILFSGCSDKPKEESIPKSKRQEQCEQRDADRELRSTLLSYISNPKFANSNFTKQITGTNAELQCHNLDESLLYFSIPENEYNDSTLVKLTLNPEDVEFAKLDAEGNKLVLGKYSFYKPGEYLFRFPAKDFRVNRNAEIRVNLGRYQYTLSPKELNNFAKDKSIHGGYLNAIKEIGPYNRYILLANHGAFVAKKGASSLERLISQITDKEQTNEQKAQRLLDFVTGLDYKFSDAQGIEVLKRPNEVLMTKGSDCSGKAILYASLLEQAGIGYRLTYFDDHIAVAVQGNFRNNNPLSFAIKGKPYSIADVTVKGFKLGSSRVGDGRGELKTDDILYMQKPGGKIYNAKTGKPLEFLH